MIPAADIARARLRWDVIAGDVALRRRGRELVGCCPFHPEKTPSFTVNPDKGFFHCFGCGAHGSPIDYVMRLRRLNFVDAVRELAQLPQQRPSTAAIPPRRRTEAPDRWDELRNILAGCGPITSSTAAHLYLWTRGLNPNQPGLLAHPALYCAEVKGPLPALVAPVTDALGVVVAVQRIYVSARLEYAGGIGPKDSRAAVATRKKSLGAMRNGAVRLRPAGRRLGLAEGVETAIGASEDYRVPVWATCGATRLGNIAIPRQVEQLLIFADHGAAGTEQAEKALQIYQRQRIPTEIVYPERQFPDFDFNDQAAEHLFHGKIARVSA
jgi:DNA primase